MVTKKAWIIRKERYGKSGFKNPEERKKKISENTKKALANPEIKAKIIIDRKRRKEKYGYINSPETRKKISEIWKKKWANGEVTRKQRTHIRGKGINTQFKKGHKVPEKWRKAVRESRAKQIFPMRDSSIEIKIQGFLQQLGIEHYTHFYIKEIKHSYQCDILVPSMNLVVEVDGDWWHGNPIKFPSPNKMQMEQIEEDKIRTKELIEKGFKVLRLWEFEIKAMKLNDFKNILEVKTNGL
ncbi:hypothetical protein LCGC14_1000650 [marine sediment metagenome]|uniref:DUF559 domain-containing protein n=1 Tax=marine sediment metagenome TaxID=412755 RepID=A0A0F9R989_9ZZZZ